VISVENRKFVPSPACIKRSRGEWVLLALSQNKTRMMGLPGRKRHWRYLQPSGYITRTWQTGGQIPDDSKNRAYTHSVAQK